MEHPLIVVNGTKGVFPKALPVRHPADARVGLSTLFAVIISTFPGLHAAGHRIFLLAKVGVQMQAGCAVYVAGECSKWVFRSIFDHR